MLSLRANFSWTIAGNVGYAVTQWGCIVVLAKLLSPTMVGQYALALAVSAPVLMFTNLKLRSAIATDAAGDYAFSDYLGLRIVMTAIAMAVVVGIALLSGYDATTVTIILIVGLAKSVDAISDLYYGLYQQIEQMDVITISQLLNGALTLAAMGGLVYATRSLVAGAIGSLVGSVVALAGIVVPANRLRHPSVQHTRPRFDARVMRRLTWLTLPLGISTALGSLRTNVPRYAIEHYLGTYHLGLYAALAYFMVAGGIVVNALGQSATPRLAKYHRDGNAAGFNTLLWRLLGMGTLLGLSGVAAVAVAGPWLLRLFYNATYARESDALLWLMVATAVTYAYIFLGTAVSAMRLFKVQVPIGVVALSVLATTVVPLVKLYGLTGAAWSLIAASVVEGGLYVVLISSRVRQAVIA